MKEKLSDISLIISWRELARQYFDKSSSWLYHKLDGIDTNGRENDFTDEEKKILKSALVDLSDRIRKASELV